MRHENPIILERALAEASYLPQGNPINTMSKFSPQHSKYNNISIFNMYHMATQSF